MPVGIDRFKNKLFITVPRRRPGIPATLNYVELDEFGENRSPDLKPFPNIDTNSLHVSLVDFSSLQNLQYVKLSIISRLRLGIQKRAKN